MAPPSSFSLDRCDIKLVHTQYYANVNKKQLSRSTAASPALPGTPPPAASTPISTLKRNASMALAPDKELSRSKLT